MLSYMLLDFSIDPNCGDSFLTNKCFKLCWGFWNFFTYLSIHTVSTRQMYFNSVVSLMFIFHMILNFYWVWNNFIRLSIIIVFHILSTGFRDNRNKTIILGSCVWGHWDWWRVPDFGKHKGQRHFSGKMSSFACFCSLCFVCLKRKKKQNVDNVFRNVGSI